MLSIQQLALLQIAESAARLHCREYNRLFVVSKGAREPS
jgi:hypothetical protein